VSRSAVTVRLATPADLAAVRRCASEAYQRYVAGMGRKPAPMVADFASAIAEGKVSVATQDEAVVGYVVFYPRVDHMHLENVAVFPAFERLGIGRQLMLEVERHARQSGFDAIELYTNEAMTENLQMYPNLGFVETGRRIEDGFSRVFFRKSV